MPAPSGYLLDTNILLYLLRGNALGKQVDQGSGPLATPLGHG